MKRVDARPGPTTLASRAARPSHRIVSSWHLMSPTSPELSELEFGLILFNHAFSRWTVRCMAAAGVKDLAAVDVLALHHVNNQGQEKKLADICFVLNVEDTHVVSYSLRKLAGLGLVESSKRGKEVYFRTSASGRDACERYRQVRETCLMPGFAGSADENARLGELAGLLRTLSGRYDQAARAAAASSFHSLDFAVSAPKRAPKRAPKSAPKRAPEKSP